MNDRMKIIIGAIFFVVLIIGADRLLKIRNRDLYKSQTDTVNNLNNYDSEAETNSRVINVTEETFEKEVLNSDKRVFVDFYATWCGPCQMLSPIIDQVSNELDDVKFVRVDVDDEERLAEEYSIYSFPTLVIIENGKEVKRTVGYLEKGELIDFARSEK